jgi:hypothetical protein
MMRTALLGCALALLVSPGRLPAQFPQGDLGGAARDLAEKLGGELARRGPRDRSQKFRVAVFPFGDGRGRYTLQMGDNGPVLRGALVDHLRVYLDRKAPGKFTVLYPEQVDEQIAGGSNDPAGISGKNLVLARRLLEAFDFQVGIVGRFEVGDFSRLLQVSNAARDESSVPPGVKIETTAILSSDVVRAGSNVLAGAVRRHGFGPQSPVGKRLGVRFFTKVGAGRPDSDNSAWEEVPLFASAEKQSRGLLYLVVPKSHKDRRYKVVLTNRGKPALHDNPADPDRMFAAALLIDGVSSFMRLDGKQYRHVAGEPASQPRWVIAPPGKRLVADPKGTFGRILRGKLVAAPAGDGATLTVPGFQKGGGVAGSFVFATAAQSVAAPELLSLRKIGTISVHFFAESLPGDVKVQQYKTESDAPDEAPAGTRMGKEVRNPTLGIRVLNLKPDPYEVWHIVYRYEGSKDLPRDLKRVP